MAISSLQQNRVPTAVLQNLRSKTATAAKTFFNSASLCFLKCFVIIPVCSTSTNYPNYPGTEGVVSKETVVLRRWGSSIQKFGFINGVDNVNWPPYRDSKS